MWGKVGLSVDNDPRVPLPQRFTAPFMNASSMLIGEYHYSVDDKGRLSLPTKFRNVLSQGVVVTRGVDRCLFVYPKATWEQFAARMATLPMNQKNTRAFARLMLAGAMDASPDRQGRVILPDYLRAYAGVKKNVVVAGVYDRLEVWDSALWQSYTKNAEKHSVDIAEDIGSFTAGSPA